MINFLAGNWGNFASVAGLVFSILAFKFAKRASKAAREARNAALRQSLSEEMNGANRTAREIVTYVGMERGEMVRGLKEQLAVCSGTVAIDSRGLDKKRRC